MSDFLMYRTALSFGDGKMKKSTFLDFLSCCQFCSLVAFFKLLSCHSLSIIFSPVSTVCLLLCFGIIVSDVLATPLAGEALVGARFSFRASLASSDTKTKRKLAAGM